MNDFIGSLGQWILENLWIPIVVGIIVWLIQERTKSIKEKKKDGQTFEEEKEKLLEDCFRKLGNKRQEEILEKEYIPIKGQKRSPHNNTDMLEPASEDERYDLVSIILNAISPQKGKLNKDRLRFTILAGSGMGKSLFAAALAKAYYKWDLYKNAKLPYELCVINLFDKSLADIEAELENKDKGRLILVLDSLDENQEAMNNRLAFIKKLEEVTNEVQVVIILGRTQFFETAEDELTRGTIAQSSDYVPFLKWERYYISPLTTDEMIGYVNIKYRDKVGTPAFKRAYDLISMEHTDIMRRPLILSFLDDIVTINFVFPDKPTNAEIYHVIIENWLNREARYNKNQLLPKLYEFTKQIAVYIYEQKNGLVLSQDEYNTFLANYGYEGEPYAFKERSLLNRTDDGYIKFAHKSFLEYFIAIDSLERPEKQYDPSELDMAKVFAQELQEIYLQDRQYPYIHMAESPFKNANFSPSIDDSEEVHKRDDLFDEWAEYIEDLSAEETPEELRSTNLYYLRKYRNDLLLDVHVLNFIRREVKLHKITDTLADNEFDNINKDMVEDFKEIDRQSDGNLYYGNRMSSRDKIAAYKQFEWLPLLKINYRKNVIFPAIGAGTLKPNEFAYAVGYGFVSSEDEVFKTIKRLISHEAKDIAFKLGLWYTTDNEEKEPDKIITIFPSVVLVYKEIKENEELVEYICRLQNLIEDLPLGKEIIIQFCAPDYRIYYSLDYNSILFNREQIQQCLHNTIEAVKISRNKEQSLYEAYNNIPKKTPKTKTTNKPKKIVKRARKND